MDFRQDKIRYMSKKEVENIEVPKPLTYYVVRDFNVLFYDDIQYDPFELKRKFLHFVDDDFEKWRKEYTDKKWRYLAKHFGFDTVFKEFCMAEFKWFKNQDSERKRQVYIQNKEKILEQHKQYYQNNKEKIDEKKKVYREKNHDKILEQQKKHREDKLVPCACGGRYMDVESKKYRHQQTKLHQKYLQNLENK